MKRQSHSNALLVELLIVVLFFMLASTILLQLFTAARTQSAKAEALTEATFLAQNLAESCQGNGSLDHFPASPDGRISFPGSSLTASVESTSQQTEAGIFTRYTINIYSGDDLIYTLPSAHYEEVAS